VQWRGSFSVFPPPIPYFSPFHCFISGMGAGMGAHGWVAGIPAMAAAFYLGAG